MGMSISDGRILVAYIQQGIVRQSSPIFIICPYKTTFKNVKSHKKTTQVKKAFCFDNCAGYFLRKKFGLHLI